MDVQTLIVGLIVLAALAYAGSAVWKKAKSFSSKTGCASDCGCGSAAKPKNFPAQIKRD